MAMHTAWNVRAEKFWPAVTEHTSGQDLRRIYLRRRIDTPERSKAMGS